MPKLPIIAAVANYNMANQLEHLLPTLVEHDYDGIFVLDDASTDESRSVVESVSSDITFVAGPSRAGRPHCPPD